MLQRVLLFIVLPIGVLAFAGYYWLGGLNEVTVEVVTEEARLLVAKRYQGQYGDLALRQAFVEARKLQEEGTLPGVLTVANLDSVSASGQSVHQLIGVTMSTSPSTVPTGYQVDTLPTGQYLRATLRANPLVMPQPRIINEHIADYANEHALDIIGLPIEFYQAGDTLRIERAVR